MNETYDMQEPIKNSKITHPCRMSLFQLKKR